MLTQLRQQFLSFWQRQSLRQRYTLSGLLLAAVAATAIFAAWANTPTYAVAFTGLSEEDAGLIVEKLTAAQTPYQLPSTGTILVPSSQVYEVRLSMARQGLPQGGTVGYELFSGTTLGMTEFTQRINYQRALEGELERTIGSLSPVSSVRVHIVTPEKALLASQQSLTTASVTLRFKPGQSVDQAQVRAITHLLASSVEGLQPENVVIVDVSGDMLSGAAPAQNDTTSSDNRLAAEAAYAAAIQIKVRNLLDLSLGPNNSVVQVSASMDWNQREVTTQLVNPTQSTLRSAQTVTETYAGNPDTIGGIPGAASNLPPLVAGTTLSDTGSVIYQRYENTNNFEFTQAEDHQVYVPGAIKRLTVSVLADGITSTTQLAALRSVIAAAAGIDETRGDLLAVESLTFDRTYYDAQAKTVNDENIWQRYSQIAAVVGAVLLVLLAFWYVQRLLSNLRLATAEAWIPAPAPALATAAATAGAGLAGPETAASLTGPAGLPSLAEPSVLPSALPEAESQAAESPAATKAAADKAAAAAAAVAAAKAAEPDEPELTGEEEELQKFILITAEENPLTVAEVIRMWLGEDEKPHAA